MTIQCFLKVPQSVFRSVLMEFSLVKALVISVVATLISSISILIHSIIMRFGIRFRRAFVATSKRWCHGRSLLAVVCCAQLEMVYLSQTGTVCYLSFSDTGWPVRSPCRTRDPRSFDWRSGCYLWKWQYFSSSLCLGDLRPLLSKRCLFWYQISDIHSFFVLNEDKICHQINVGARSNIFWLFSIIFGIHHGFTSSSQIFEYRRQKNKLLLELPARLWSFVSA